MKVKKISLNVLLFFVFLIALGCSKSKEETINPIPFGGGKAILISGAGGKIPQLISLLRAMEEKGNLKGIKFIGGLSSGSIVSVLLNGVLSKKITWDEIYDFLDKLKNPDIFTANGTLPVNISPS